MTYKELHLKEDQLLDSLVFGEISFREFLMEFKNIQLWEDK